MFKNLLFLLLSSTTLLAFDTGNLNNSSYIDSTAYYCENALFYKNNKYYDKAIQNAKKAINYSRKRLDNNAIANSYYTLGIINVELKKYNQAIDELVRAVSIYNTLQPNTKLALSYYNLGVCYLNENNFTRSEFYFDKAVLIYKKLGEKNAENMIHIQKAILLIEKNQIQEGQNILKNLLNLSNIPDNAITKSEVYYQLGLLEEYQKKPDQALKYLFDAFNLSNSDLEQHSKIVKKISEIYEKLNQPKKAIEYLKKHLQIKDSITYYEHNSKNDFLSQQLKVDGFMRSSMEKMEKMEQEKEEQEKASRFSKLINILSIALITILSLLSLSLYKNNIIRNKSNELLKDKNLELEEAKERIEKASKARAEFLSTVSHELRTPLNAINGISHLLLDDNPRENQIEYLKSLKFSGNYLLNYINEILEINRIESNNIQLENINFNFKELLQNIHNSLHEQAKNNNNEFILKIQDNVPDFLIGDPTKLSQIFINLTNNAIKFTQNGTITVCANTLQKNTSHCYLEFKITDTGIGIPNDQQYSIFESFSQGSVEINRKYGGTGLGLTIVKRLIQLMGGNINVKSLVGVGSTFSFQLDFEIGKPPLKLPINPKNNILALTNKKVLLVEDNKINQMITRKILEKKNMICTICETGEDAITLVQNHPYDLVLMDIHLPGINGTTATQEIRKFNTQIPIIALTAISLNENRETLLSFGMNEVITKPFDPEKFYDTITDTLKQ